MNIRSKAAGEEGKVLELHNHKNQQQNSSASLPLKAAMFSAFLCILFGANATAIKISFTGCGVFTTGGIRFIGGALAIFTWGLITGKKLHLEPERLLKITPLALILFLQLSLFYFGQSKTLASHGALIANLLPFVVMIMAHIFIKEDRITPKKVVGLLMGFTAVSLLFIDNGHVNSKTIEGDFLILLAVLVWGGHVVYIKRIIHN